MIFGSCSVTEAGYPWWLVDIRGHYPVVEVHFLTRNPVSAAKTTQNIVVGVTDVPSNGQKPSELTPTQYRKCGVFVDNLEDYSRTRIPCSSARGRYVFVKSRTTGISLRLCEVEVYVLREYYGEY
ncbi:hypothetical protein LSAT2_001532 [Lamellibrachia satsuma]|nr:hypothetical protein LSAT2_001532 [Lamellibrachia satsuma]